MSYKIMATNQILRVKCGMIGSDHFEREERAEQFDVIVPSNLELVKGADHFGDRGQLIEQEFLNRVAPNTKN